MTAEFSQDATALAPADAPTLDIEAIWQAILAVPGPGPDPQMPDARPWVAPPGAWLKTSNAIRVRMALSGMLFAGAVGLPRISRDAWVVVVGISMLIIALVVWPWRLPRTPLKARLQAGQAEGIWEHTQKRWRQEGAEAVFLKEFNRLKKVRTHLRNPEKERSRLRAELPERSRARQLRDFLSRFPIADADIPDISSERKATLAADGIRTAADVERAAVREVYGFGAEMTGKILLWRESLELKFTPDPDAAPDPRDAQSIEDEHAAWLKDLTEEFKRGPAKLRWVSEEITRARPQLLADLDQAWADYQMALLARG